MNLVFAADAIASNAAMTLALVLIGAAVGVVAFVGFNTYDERQAIRNSMRQLEEYGQPGTVETERERELLRPAYERALAPVMGGFINAGRKLFPTDFVSRTRKKHQAAGRYDPAAVDRFLALQIVSLLLIPVAFVLFPVMNVLHMSLKMNLIIFLLLTAVALMLPDLAAQQRHRRSPEGDSAFPAGHSGPARHQRRSGSGLRAGAGPNGRVGPG